MAQVEAEECVWAKGDALLTNYTGAYFVAVSCVYFILFLHSPTLSLYISHSINVICLGLNTSTRTLPVIIHDSLNARLANSGWAACMSMAIKAKLEGASVKSHRLLHFGTHSSRLLYASEFGSTLVLINMPTI